MYSSPEFGELAEWLRSFIDRIAMDLPDRHRERLADIFVANSKYEYLFWDAAYRMEDMARLGVRVYTRSGIRRATGMRPPRSQTSALCRPLVCGYKGLRTRGQIQTHISHINPAGLAVISNGDTRCSRIAEHSGYHEC